jgi:multidrug efflux system membrane fusion protein
MRRLRLSVVVVVAAAGLIACGGTSSQSPESGGQPRGGGQGGGGNAPGGQGGPGGRGRAPAIPVRAGLVKVEQVTYSIQAVGSLEAEDMIQVTAEVDGVLTQVNFREGDQVGKGTVLATIDPERYRLEADRAEANYRRAIAEGAQAAATLARREALAKENLVSVEDLNQSRTADERFAADAAAAKAARDLAAQNLSRSWVKPRRGGVIDKRLVDTGTFVRTGTQIAALVDLSRLRLRFRVSETESLKAKKGQIARFRVAAAGDRDFGATIYHVGQVADPTSRQVEVLAWVQNPGVLKPGFFAEVSLPSESKKDAIIIPETAVQASDRGFVAFVIQDGKAQVRQVELGPRTGGGLVEILSGLNPGETIVFQGSDRITNGTAVIPTTGDAPGAGGAGQGGGRQGGPRGPGRPPGEKPEGQGQESQPGGSPKNEKPKGERSPDADSAGGPQ